MAHVLNSEIVKEYGYAAGASVVGIAASNAFHLAPNEFAPDDVLDGCLSVVVLGFPFPPEAILDASAEYIDIRNAVNNRINGIAKDVGKRIKKDGYNARDIGGMSGKWVDGFQHGPISLKHAAELAGLGVIGKNYLLTNPHYGNLLWFGAVLTDAYLVPDPKCELDVCRDCNLCVELCPAKALDNPDSFRKKDCAATCFKLVDRKWRIKCFLCRKICPHCFGEQAHGSPV